MMEKHINKILWIVAISFMLIAGCASAFGQINFTLKRVTLDSINGRTANIHMNDSVIFHAGTNIAIGSADNYEKHVTKFDWDYTDGIFFQNYKLNGKFIIITSVILREVTQLSSTSGTTTVTLIDEGSSGVVWASIIADGTGALELTNETIQTYPMYVNEMGQVANFTFVGSVDDLTGGSLSVYIEYIEFTL